MPVLDVHYYSYFFKINLYIIGDSFAGRTGGSMKKLVLAFSFLILGSNFIFGADSPEDQAEPIFLDYASSATVCEEALQEFIRVSHLDGNSSGFNNHSKQLKEIEKKSAESIAKKLGCKSDQIIFTNSATTSNNIVILGFTDKNPECHLVVSSIEHPSAFNVFKHLEKKGHKVTYLKVDRYGRVNLKQLKDILDKAQAEGKPSLVSIQFFNSDIGIKQDINQISKIVHEHKNAFFHSDCAQSFGKYDVDTEKIDFISISGYKIGAPMGIAALYIKDDRARSSISPILFGGGDVLFPGSKPTALIAAFGKASELYKVNLNRITENFNALKSELDDESDGFFVNSLEPSHVFSVSIAGVLLADIRERLEKKYSFSSGCSCSKDEKFHIKDAIDPEGKIPSCTLRISFSDGMPVAILKQFARDLKQAVYKLRSEKKVNENCEKSEKDRNELLHTFDLIKDEVQ